MKILILLKSFIHSLFITGLIALGSAFITLALILSMNGSSILSLISTVIGLTVGVRGWLLKKSKKPMSLIRNASSGILLTIGLGIILFPILILTLKGTDTAFVNIALTHFVLGLIIGLIGLSMRNQRSQ